MNRQTIIASLGILISAGTASAITITTGNPGNTGTDNVLFNNGALPHTGTLVKGDFNPDNGYIVDFTSSSGNSQLIADGGQAKIEGGSGNDPFTHLKFNLENNATFTKAIINVISAANANGTIQFTVNQVVGAPFVSSFLFDKNGNNFFGIEAQGIEKITSVEFLTSLGTADARQIRIGGFANADDGGGNPSGNLPDGGATFGLLGLGALALGFLRKAS